MSRSVVAPIAMTMSDGDFDAKISFEEATSSKVVDASPTSLVSC